MRVKLAVCIILIFTTPAFSRAKRPAPPLPAEFEIGRHTFFDFGPPFDYYDIFLVRPAASGSSIERISLTPAGNACTQAAKIENATGLTAESIAELLGKTNPCAIPEKELRRELKRCKKCLVFSGADVAMRVQCGTRTRIVRSDILDRDWFDPAPHTPEHTSWTMELLHRISQPLGPDVMQKPVFSTDEQSDSVPNLNSEALRDLGSGKYDGLFPKAPHRPSDLYRAAQNPPLGPTVRLVSSTLQPEAFVAPKYPPIAKTARIEGTIVFKGEIDVNGNVTNIAFESGPQMLFDATKQTVSDWKFAKQSAPQQITAALEFKMNCSADEH